MAWSQLIDQKREDLYHFINGIWSGIPLCCILFFIRNHRAHPQGLGWALALKRECFTDKYVRCDECWKAGREIVTRKNGGICRWVWSWEFHKRIKEKYGRDA